MHRLTLAAAVVSAAALIGPPAAGAAQRAVTLTITGQQAAVTPIDLGPAGTSPGDLTVFSGTITNGVGVKGTVSGTSIVITAGTSANTVSGSLTYQLPDGQIVVGGLAQQVTNRTGLRRGI